MTMGASPPTADERRALEAVARYQFSLPADATFLPRGDVRVLRRRSGRVDRVYVGDERLCTLTTHGRLTLGVAGGRRLHAGRAPPANRVVLDDEAVPFVADGRNAFAKFVLDVDPAVRPRDEVVVVDPTDAPVAVGRAELSADGMLAFDRGVAVSIRHGLGGEPPG